MVLAMPTRHEVIDGIHYIINEEISLWGVGETYVEATEDFHTVVMDIFKIFQEEGRENLGPLMLIQLEYLEQYIINNTTYTA